MIPRAAAVTIYRSWLAARLARADGLGAHHRAPGGQGGKDVDDQDVDEIHQRHAGDCGLSGGGDHHDVRHAHHDGQKLFDN
jgi:hypothetical protein